MIYGSGLRIVKNQRLFIGFQRFFRSVGDSGIRNPTDNACPTMTFTHMKPKLRSMCKQCETDAAQNGHRSG